MLPLILFQNKIREKHEEYYQVSGYPYFDITN
jgi:hypothetical protein